MSVTGVAPGVVAATTVGTTGLSAGLDVDQGTDSEARAEVEATGNGGAQSHVQVTLPSLPFL